MWRLAVAALVIALAGCGGSQSKPSASTSTTQGTSSQQGSTPELAVSLPQLQASSINSQLASCSAAVADWNDARTALQALAASDTDGNLNTAISDLDRLSGDLKSLVQDIARAQGPSSASILTYDQASSFFFMVGSVFAGVRNHYVPSILVTSATQQEPTVVPSAEAALASDCLGS